MLRLIALLLLIALVALQVRLWAGSGGLAEVRALRETVARQAEENRRLEARNEALRAEVEDLKQGDSAIEERARSELGMIRPGEVLYRVVEPAPVEPDDDGSPP